MVVYTHHVHNVSFSWFFCWTQCSHIFPTDRWCVEGLISLWRFRSLNISVWAPSASHILWHFLMSCQFGGRCAANSDKYCTHVQLWPDQRTEQHTICAIVRIVHDAQPSHQNSSPFIRSANTSGCGLHDAVRVVHFGVVLYQHVFRTWPANGHHRKGSVLI